MSGPMVSIARLWGRKRGEFSSAADQHDVARPCAAAVGIAVLLPVVDHPDTLGQRAEALVIAEGAAFGAPRVSEIPGGRPRVAVLAQLVVQYLVDEVDLAQPH